MCIIMLIQQKVSLEFIGEKAYQEKLLVPDGQSNEIYIIYIDQCYLYN